MKGPQPVRRLGIRRIRSMVVLPRAQAPPDSRRASEELPGQGDRGRRRLVVRDVGDAGLLRWRDAWGLVWMPYLGAPSS